MHVCLPSEDLAMVTHNTTVKLLFILFAVSLSSPSDIITTKLITLCVCGGGGGGGGRGLTAILYYMQAGTEGAVSHLHSTHSGSTGCH